MANNLVGLNKTGYKTNLFSNTDKLNKNKFNLDSLSSLSSSQSGIPSANPSSSAYDMGIAAAGVGLSYLHKDNDFGTDMLGNSYQYGQSPEEQAFQDTLVTGVSQLGTESKYIAEGGAMLGDFAENQLGENTLEGSIAHDSITYGASGAAIGGKIAPGLGHLIGGAVGVTAGVATGTIGHQNQKKKAEEQKQNAITTYQSGLTEQGMKMRNFNEQFNKDAVYGNKQFSAFDSFEDGGSVNPLYYYADVNKTKDMKNKKSRMLMYPDGGSLIAPNVEASSSTTYVPKSRLLLASEGIDNMYTPSKEEMITSPASTTEQLLYLKQQEQLRKKAEMRKRILDAQKAQEQFPAFGGGGKLSNIGYNSGTNYGYMYGGKLSKLM